MENSETYSQSDIENSKLYTHKSLNYLAGIAFLLCSLADFYQRELYAPLFFLIRFFIFTIMLVFVSPLNTRFFKKNHQLFTAVFLTSISTISTFFVILSENSYHSSTTFIGLLAAATALLFQASSKYFLPITLTPLLIIATYYGVSDSSFSNNSLLLKSIFLFTITFIAHFNFYRFTEKSYKFRLKFEKQKKAMEELLNENNQLVRILCHDLGNSLTIVDMTTHLLEKTLKPTKEQQGLVTKSLDRLKRAVTTQKEIIEHVKQKEAIESGKTSIDLSPVNLNIIFEKVKFIFQTQIKEKNLNLNIIYSTDKSPHVMAELVSLSNNVINNIVSNAIKFSKDGSDINITTWNDKSFVYVTIEDNGIGMSEELVKNVFNTNVKTSRPGVRGERGTGFGMPLAKAYMLKYNGEIFVESKEGKGTRFTLKFQNIENHRKKEPKAA